jgi:6-phosphogluconolactonase (cycloisomerase 2 family)
MKSIGIFARSVAAGALLLAMSLAGYAVAPDRDDAQAGAVYVMSNLAGGNTIVSFHRDAQGGLTPWEEVSTGGKGSGPGPLPPDFGNSGQSPLPLESQDSLVASEDGRFLLAVNAGTNDISVLEITDDGLRLTDRASSGGIFPASIAYRHGLAYVVNLGGVPTLDSSPGTPTMTGFFLTKKGKLQPIPGSTRVTGDFGSAPADIVFSPDGRFLVLAERPTNLLDVFPVNDDGTVGAKVVSPSDNLTPFGMAFTRHGVLVVTESDDRTPRFPFINASTTSTYRIRDDGTLETISRSVPDLQTAACWVRFSKNQHFAFVVNSPSGTVSSYSLTPGGELSLISAIAADTGGHTSAPIDEAITPNGKYLYVDAPHLGAPNIGEIRGWRVNEDGSLTPVTIVGGLPISFSGIVAF